jgi:hypothetical protein
MSASIFVPKDYMVVARHRSVPAWYQNIAGPVVASYDAAIDYNFDWYEVVEGKLVPCDDPNLWGEPYGEDVIDVFLRATG